MPSFKFRPLTAEDIAAAIGSSAESVVITTYPDGTIEVTVPGLTSAKADTLKAMFTSRGYIEETASG